MNWEGDHDYTFEEFLAEWRRATDDRSFLPTSGDSSEGAATRFLAAITQITGDAGPSDTVAVVAHGGVTADSLRTIAGDAHMRDVRPELMENGVPCGAVTILERAAAMWRLVQLPSFEHLDQSVEHWPA